MARRRKYRRNPSGRDILVFAGIAVGGYLIYEHLKPKPIVAVAPAPGGALVPLVQAGSSTIGTAVDAIAKLFGGSSTPTPVPSGPTVFLPQGMPGTPTSPSSGSGPASSISDAISSLFSSSTPAPSPAPTPNAGGGMSGLGSLG